MTPQEIKQMEKKSGMKFLKVHEETDYADNSLNILANKLRRRGSMICEVRSLTSQTVYVFEKKNAYQKGTTGVFVDSPIPGEAVTVKPRKRNKVA